MLFQCNGLHAVLPSAVGGLVGWMIMVPISNTFSSLSVYTPSVILTMKREVKSLDSSNYLPKSAYSFLMFYSCRSRQHIVFQNAVFSTSYFLQSHLTQQVFFTHMHQPTHFASPLRFTNNYTQIGPQKRSLTRHKSTSSALTAFYVAA